MTLVAMSTRLVLPLLCVSIGLVLVDSPNLTAAVLAASILLVFAIVIVQRFDAIPRRPIEFLAAGILVLLPLAPYLNLYASAGTLARLFLSGAFVFLLATGTIERNAELPRPVRAAILIFVGIQLVALLGAPSLEYGLLRAFNWVMFVPLAFARWDARARRVVAVFLVLSGFVLMIGLLLQVAGVLAGTWGGLQIGEARYARRYTSFLLNPNDFGLSMLIVALLSYVASGRTRGTARYVFFASGSVFVVAMLLSASRGALVAAPLIFAYLAVAGSRRAVVALTIALVVAAAVVAAAAPSLREPVSRTVSSIGDAARGQDASFSQRHERWASVIENGRTPLIGAGYGGYGGSADSATAVAFGLSTRQELYRTLTVDNSWLKLWLEEGVVGVAFLLAAYSMTLRRAWRVRRVAPLAAVAAGGTMIAFIVRAATVDILDINPWNAMVWLTMGIVFSLSRKAPMAGDA